VLVVSRNEYEVAVKDRKQTLAVQYHGRKKKKRFGTPVAVGTYSLVSYSSRPVRAPARDGTPSGPSPPAAMPR
jgi:hypothetical protein